MPGDLPAFLFMANEPDKDKIQIQVIHRNERKLERL